MPSLSIPHNRGKDFADGEAMNGDAEPGMVTLNVKIKPRSTAVLTMEDFGLCRPEIYTPSAIVILCATKSLVERM